MAAEAKSTKFAELSHLQVGVAISIMNFFVEEQVVQTDADAH